MKFRIEKMKFITREYVRASPEKIFLFGDNLQAVGMGGQAGAMRGEPNAIGIPTKKTPSGDDAAFFTDAEFDQNKAAIDFAISRLESHPPNSVLVIPEDGLGTGLAELPMRAPMTFRYLEGRLVALEDA